jgi:hypothetical protein
LRWRLDPIIVLEHALVKLALKIGRSFLAERIGAVYEDKPRGTTGLPTRRRVGHPQAHRLSLQ